MGVVVARAPKSCSTFGSFLYIIDGNYIFSPFNVRYISARDSQLNWSL